jgi:hypothetical protein
MHALAGFLRGTGAVQVQTPGPPLLTVPRHGRGASYDCWEWSQSLFQASTTRGASGRTARGYCGKTVGSGSRRVPAGERSSRASQRAVGSSSLVPASSVGEGSRLGS